ncbi:hypothetical protein [Acinetobacter lactucae]|uniref:hypothetical protein n=1 Tax=Acinetobacter lactucae TaxID=1785128 RepID=UPI0015F38C6C|nr:hypothetical protein [Acinetobacter lactucae]
MSKYRIYNASFPVKHLDIYEKILNWEGSEFYKFKILRTRDYYFDVVFIETNIIEEEFIDLDNNKQIIKKLVRNEIFFSILNRKENNFLTLNEPRSISTLKNIFSKIFNFEFYIDSIKVHPLEIVNEFQNSVKSSITIDKIEIKNALFNKNITMNSTIKASFDIRDNLNDIIKTKYYEISKINGFISEFPKDRFLITNEYVIKFEGSLELPILNFVHTHTF